MSRSIQRQRRAARAAAVLGTATLIAAVVLPVQYVMTEPGPVFDVLGEQNGTPVVTVEGAATYPTTGQLDMVTVSQFGGTSTLPMGSAILGWLLPTRTVEPRDVRYPPGTEPGQEEQIDAAVFEASASTALAATADYLGRPVYSAVLVSSVEAGSPADGNLESGDMIKAIAGTPTASSRDVSQAVAALPAGSQVAVDYVRDGEPASVSITSVARPDGSPGAYLGLLLVDSYTSDFVANVALKGIGGPSAGMVFALAMTDRMTPGDLLGGGHVAGTGTIDAQGRVGPIGGIDKKAISVQRSGAELFVVPKENCADLAGRVPQGLTVAAVDTLSAAIDSITAWRSGDGELPSCP